MATDRTSSSVQASDESAILDFEVPLAWQERQGSHIGSLQELKKRRMADLRVLNGMLASGASDSQLSEAADKLASMHPVQFCAFTTIPGSNVLPRLQALSERGSAV